MKLFLHTACLPALVATALVLNMSPAQAAAGSTALKTPSLSVGAGLLVAPVYEGASAYTTTPLPLLKAQMPTEDWGTFTASFPEGLRWDLPLGDTFGAALLMGYDPGRKESIRTLSGHNHHLRGMGDLGGTGVAGLELSVNLEPYRIFVRGLQAMRERHYGGENLGRTVRGDLGVDMSLPLSDTLSFSTETFLTWSDRHDMMASFGVTPEQAARTSFRAHRAGGGLRGVTAQWGLDWQYTPQLTFSGGVRVTGLTAAAAKNSPLVEKNVSGGLFMNTMYRF